MELKTSIELKNVLLINYQRNLWVQGCILYTVIVEVAATLLVYCKLVRNFAVKRMFRNPEKQQPPDCNVLIILVLVN